MKTIADFKRLMIPGSIWHGAILTNGVWDDSRLGTRECKLNNSVNFAFQSKINIDKLSYCNWPKKTEAVFLQDGSILIDGTLKYSPVTLQ